MTRPSTVKGDDVLAALNNIEADMISQTDTATQTLGTGELQHDHAFEKLSDFIVRYNAEKALTEAICGSLSNSAGKVAYTKSGNDAGDVTEQILSDFCLTKGHAHIYYKSDMDNPLEWATTAYVPQGYKKDQSTANWNLAIRFQSGGRYFYMICKVNGPMFANAETTLTQQANVGDTRIYVTSTAHFKLGEEIKIGDINQGRNIKAIGADYFDLYTQITTQVAVAGRVFVKPIDVDWSDIYANGNKASYPNSIFADLTSSYDVTFKNLILLSFGGPAIKHKEGIHPQYRDLIIEYSQYGLWLNMGLCDIVNCKFWEQSEASLYMDGNSGLWNIHGNEFRDDLKWDIYMNGSGWHSILGNRFLNTGKSVTNTYSPLFIASTAANSGTDFSHNFIFGAYGGSSVKPRFLFDSDALYMLCGPSFDWTFIGNKFSNMGTGVFPNKAAYGIFRSTGYGGSPAIIRDNKGWNPVGKLQARVDGSGDTFYPFYVPSQAGYESLFPYGNSANPVSTKNYVVRYVDVLLTSVGGDVTDITIKDPSNNVIVSGLTAITTPIFLPIGYKIGWTFDPNPPTVTAFGV